MTLSFPSSFGETSFSYTGTYTWIDDGSGNWRLKFLTSGTFTPSVGANIDIFLVGGGGRGAYFTTSGGGGAGSGKTTTLLNYAMSGGTDYSIVVGEGGTGSRASGAGYLYGGDGSDTTAFGQTALKGYGGGNRALSNVNMGGDGGSGGGSSSSSGGSDGSNGSGTYYGVGQGTTTKEFAEAGGTLYASGGSGKGSGISPVTKTANTGDGGDGAYASSSNGASGIVIIRNKR